MCKAHRSRQMGLIPRKGTRVQDIEVVADLLGLCEAAKRENFITHSS